MKSNVCYLSNPCTPTPSFVTVQSPDGLKKLANCVAYVISNNTTYYISNCHEMTVISTGDVFVSNYDPVANPLGLRGQVCYDFAQNKALIFNEAGDYRVANLTEVQS